ncbi:ubiquitin carboxyl-terminal hydrolase 1-like [Montipora capricornis]|uniref:ubiquitin carboxyl-terminal hydrolase 1-like n=1 Tax=Montipora capricornis TaxID=246305 RepID=UPI0035F1F999
MPSVSEFDSPPSSPKSPPRKKTKFSLHRRKKTVSSSDCDRDSRRDKLYPIFTSPATRNVSDDEIFEPPKPPAPFAGLINHGNICYANAILQVLRHCPGLTDSVDRIDARVAELYPKCPKSQIVEAKDIEGVSKEVEAGNGSSGRPVACELKQLFSEMKDLEKNYNENKENCEHLIPKKNALVLAAKPLDFMEIFRKQNPMFEDNLQHDAQEFLCSLLVSLQDTEKEIKKKIDTASPYSSPLKDLFHGQLLHQTKCLTCEDAKKRFENFQDISVPIQKEVKVNDPKTFSPTPKKAQDTQSLLWALSQFATVEHLTGDNKYFCENCLTHTEAEISTSFEKLPKVLTIHLKRFTANALSGFSGYVSKINTNLATPMELVISEWCSKTCAISNPTYHLFGIVMHSGMTSCSGHYQAYVKVATPNDVDFNNNGQTNHHDNCQNRNDNKVYANRESSGECNNCKESVPNGTPVDCKTFYRNESDKTDDSDIPSPQRSAEKANTTCIPGITRYFLHRTRKYSKLENSEDHEGSLPTGDLTGGIRCRRHSTPSYSFKGLSKSLNKIQNFQHGGLLPSRNPIRQLNFQDCRKQCNSEADDPSHDKQKPLICSLIPDTHYQWIHFDDAEVAVLEECDVTALLSSSESSFTSPYLLFYKLGEP